MALLSPSEVRRRALLAATKVTVSAALLAGCGGRVEEPTVAALDADSADSGLPLLASDAAFDVAADGSACGAALTIALADAGDPAVSKDPSVVACCQEILPAWSFGADAPVSYEVARACCQVVGGDTWWELGFPACTPWGPPMPPSMPASDEALA